MPDHLLMGLTRLETANNQITMNYKYYLVYKLGRMEIEFREYVNTHWKDRTEFDINMMNSWTKAISTTEKLLKSIKENEDEFKD